MSETVQIPVDTLKRWEDEYGHRIPPVFYEEIIAFIPEPLKVGDSITGEQFAALPPRSVAIDSDGDVWVSTNEGDATLVQKKSVYASHEDIITDDGVYIASDMGRGTLVHIGWSDEVL